MNDNKTLKDIVIEETEQELASNLPEFSASPEEMLAKIKAKEKKAKRRRIGCFVVAAVLLLAFVTIGMKCSDTFFTVDADKNGKEEIVTDDGVIIEDEGWGSSSEDGIVITDWEEVSHAKAFIREMLVPKHIPKGYEFKELIVENIDGGATCKFLFIDNMNTIEICQHITYTNVQALEIEDVKKKIKSKKGTVYLRMYDEYKIATICIDDGLTIEVNSNLTENEIIKIIENMN